VSASWTQESRTKDRECARCLQFAKIAIRHANMVAKKEERKKEEGEKGKMIRCQLKATRLC
jgi:hypothetical protein